MQGRPSDARPQLEPHRRLGNRDRLKNKRPTNLKRVFTPLPSGSVDTSPMGLSVNIYNTLRYNIYMTFQTWRSNVLYLCVHVCMEVTLSRDSQWPSETAIYSHKCARRVSLEGLSIVDVELSALVDGHPRVHTHLPHTTVVHDNCAHVGCVAVVYTACCIA